MNDSNDLTDNKVFDFLFSESDTYSIIPEMLEQACKDVSESNYDDIKEHSIIHHISGMIDIIASVSSCLEKLNKQAIILDMNLENTMDEEQYEKYIKIKNFLDTLVLK